MRLSVYVLPQAYTKGCTPQILSAQPWKNVTPIVTYQLAVCRYLQCRIAAYAWCVYPLVEGLKPMDTLSRSEIESALAARLPSYAVACTLHADGTLSVVLSGPETDHFAITGIVRAHYRGAEAIARLANEILREMVVSRRGMRSERRHASPNPTTWQEGQDL